MIICIIFEQVERSGGRKIMCDWGMRWVCFGMGKEPKRERKVEDEKTLI